VRLVRGRGRLTSAHSVAVGEASFTARRGIVIATGSKPVIPPIPGLRDVDYWTTHDAIRTTRVPETLVVLGGGAVGCELGQVFGRFGVDVTIIEGGERLLPMEEPEASHALTDALRAEGVNVCTGQPVGQVASDGDRIAVTLRDGTTNTAQRLLVATGRAPELADLGLEAAGIDASAHAIAVDERLRAIDGVWAIGDATAVAMFTHVALYQAGLVVADILGNDPPPADYRAVPRVTFTDPEVASVGITEAQAHAVGRAVTVTVKALPATFRGWLHGPAAVGLVKLVVDRDDDALVGATSVGPHGGELLGLLGVAIHARVPLSTLRTMIYAFPTFYGAIGEAVGAYARGLQDVLDPEGDRALHT
jgi:pyruvate/2-oxoglutarate dehydrogenase complex dihydrolipoamide dehydrogenase (E3) component